MRKIIQKPYLYWTIIIFILYLGLNIYISDFYETLQYIPLYTEQIHWGKLILGIIFTIIIAALVAINSVYSYIRYKHHQQIKKSGVIACVGAIGGLATGVCSSCVVAIFPLFFGLFGITFSWISLPFQGLEIQALMIVFLAVSLWWMKKNNSN